jgi:succinate dehydrogenase / fumarate reductase membrane anchor subunit
MNGAGRARPESGIELYAWLFMRVSGVVLLALALGHLAIMHVLNNIESINYQFVARRYLTPFWRTYDLVMLWLALIHGLNGVRTLVEDYVGARGWRVVSLATLYVLGFMFLALGSLVILTFHPQ